MNRTMSAASAVLAAAVLSPAAPAVAATGQSAPPRPDPGAAYQARRTDLILSYAAEAGEAAKVKLRCDPYGGAHPTPIKACDALRQVDGKPDRLRPVPAMCMMIYAPVTAQITGTWRGQKIHWSKTFGNTCELSRATGTLFRF